MVSKELLSEILEKIQFMDVEKVVEVYKSDSEIYFTASVMNINTKEYTIVKRYFNIHELAYKCKEWAFNRSEIHEEKYIINSDIKWARIYRMPNFVDYVHLITKSTEPEAVFAATQWILEQETE